MMQSIFGIKSQPCLKEIKRMIGDIQFGSDTDEIVNIFSGICTNPKSKYGILNLGLYHRFITHDYTQMLSYYYQCETLNLLHHNYYLGEYYDNIEKNIMQASRYY